MIPKTACDAGHQPRKERDMHTRDGNEMGRTRHAEYAPLLCRDRFGRPHRKSGKERRRISIDDAFAY